MSEVCWSSPEELLVMFSVDPSLPAAQDFCQMVSEAALLLAHPELKCGTWAVAQGFLRRRHWSPMLFWSQQKRLLRPFFDADFDTLRGIGLDIPEKLTAYAIAHAAACAMVRRGGGERFPYEKALLLRSRLEGGEFHAPPLPD